jgi:hypothetical protein
MDWVRLTADPEASPGATYDITWHLDPGPRPLALRLFYDHDRDPANGYAGPISAYTPPPPVPTPAPPRPMHRNRIYLPLVGAWRTPYTVPTTHRWSVPPGLNGPVYLVAEADDGLQVTRWYSEVPLVVR